MMRKRYIAAGACTGAVAAALFWPQAEGAAAISIDAADLARGERLYAETCASCHGARLEGMPNWRQPGPDGVLPAPPHDPSGHTWHHGDGYLFDYTKHGGQAVLDRLGISDVRSGMPGFEGELSDAEIRDVLAWIKSTWPERIRDAQRARTVEEGL
ncbi:MAG: c-type cytochrome [Paracoccaceae bacterium]